MKYTVHFTTAIDNKTIAQICESKDAASRVVVHKLIEMYHDCMMQGQTFNIIGKPRAGDAELHAEVTIDDTVVLVIDAKPMLH